MKLESVLIRPHPIWEIFADINSFDDYKKKLPTIVLTSDVDDEIKSYYQPISKLLEFGYLEYQFITVAFTNSLMMLELILRRFYKKKANNQKISITLYELINWLENENYITEDLKKKLLELKEVRNSLLHPSNNSVLPLNCIGNIEFILNIANTFSLN